MRLWVDGKAIRKKNTMVIFKTASNKCKLPSVKLTAAMHRALGRNKFFT